ncbi:hypothetical protein BDW69DRAFT_192291 [Aspergillus filifer]
MVWLVGNAFVADEFADVGTLATDILSQAEHGRKGGRENMRVIEGLLKNLPTAGDTSVSWELFRVVVVVVESLDEARGVADGPREALAKMSGLGTNHILLTRHAARYTGGLWEVKSEKTCGELGRLCRRAARVELFGGDPRSGDLRANKYLGDQYDWIRKYEEVSIPGICSDSCMAIKGITMQR